MFHPAMSRLVRQVPLLSVVHPENEKKREGIARMQSPDRFKCPSALEAYPKSEPEDTLVNAFTAKLTRARDFQEIRVRYVGVSRGGEVRRIRRVKDFRPKL